MKLINKKVYLSIIIFFFISITLYFFFYDYQNLDKILSHITGEVITFNYESGFYDKELQIKLTPNNEMPKDAKIYYTLDGDEPTNESLLYTKPIKLELSNQAKMYPVKAIIYYKNSYSDVIEYDYIIGKNISNRYDLNVISITTAHKNLYDYNKGIFVKGETYDINKEKGLVNVDGYIEGNYHQRSDDWVKSAHLTMFNNKGKVLINDNIGIIVSGGTSATYDIKSLKIISDTIYNSKNKFSIDYEFNDPDLPKVKEYKSLRLRSGSQDFLNGCNIKSSLFSRLAKESGFNGISDTKRAVIYLNGEFYGIFSIEQNFSDSYLKDKYALPSKSISKYKGSELEVLQNANILQYFKKDLNIKENREELEKYVDMDNYILYYAINILANNNDWPIRNYEIWKYTDEYYESNTYTDGRYRFLSYDHDYIYKKCLDNDCTDSDIFNLLIANEEFSKISTFKNVMNSTYYRQKFITIILDLIDSSFNTENILNIAEEEYNRIKNEVDISLNENQKKTFHDEYIVLQKMIKKRNGELKQDIKKYFY